MSDKLAACPRCGSECEYFGEALLRVIKCSKRECYYTVGSVADGDPRDDHQRIATAIPRERLVEVLDLVPPYWRRRVDEVLEL